MFPMPLARLLVRPIVQPMKATRASETTREIRRSILASAPSLGLNQATRDETARALKADSRRLVQLRERARHLDYDQATRLIGTGATSTSGIASAVSSCATAASAALNVVATTSLACFHSLTTRNSSGKRAEIST